MKKIVVFVTSVFHDSKTGPAIYAHYVNNYFSNRTGYDIAFKLVVPEKNVLQSGSGLSIYNYLSKKAIRVCKEYKDKGYHVITHYNIPQNFMHANEYSDFNIVQINDYKQATLFNNILEKYKSYGFRRFLQYLFRRFIEIKALKEADLIIANSHYTKGILSSYNSKILKNKKLITLYKSVDIDRFRSNGMSFKGEFLNIISVGSDWKTKGFVYLIEQVSHFIQRNPKLKVSLTIIGVDDPEFNEHLKGKNFIRNLGPLSRESLAIELSKNHLYILPSEDEALGVSLLEAISANLFVLGNDVGGIPEIINDGKTGLLFDSQVKFSLVDKIEQYIDLPPQDIEEVKSNARAHLKKFEKSEMLNSLSKIYENAFSNL